MKSTKSLTLIALIAMSPASRAAVLIDSSGITAVAGANYSADFDASRTLDGLTLEGFKSTGDAGPPVRPSGHQFNHWITNDGVLSSTITFDLGGSYDLSKISVLNTSNSNWNDRETDTFTIETSSDGITYSAPGAPISLQDYTLGFQDVPLTDIGVTHVRLNVTNDPLTGTDTGTADVAVGLNEVQFFQAVPEPSSSILLGLASAIFLHRKRRS